MAHLTVLGAILCETPQTAPDEDAVLETKEIQQHESGRDRGIPGAISNEPTRVVPERGGYQSGSDLMDESRCHRG